MARETSFRRNLALTGIVHLALLFGLARWGGSAKKPEPPEILWMDAGMAQAIAAASPPAEPEAAATPPPEPPATPPVDVAGQAADPAPPAPEPTTAPGDLALPSSPTPEPTPAPERTPTATPKPKPKPTPRKALKVKATPTPKRSVAKKDPKPKSAGVAAKSARKSVPDIARKSASGTGNQGSGSGNAAQINWYARMLYDRLFSAWSQPRSVVSTGAHMSALARIRIEKDGRISDFKIVRSSGNVVVDESVQEVATRVKQVDPLPAGFGEYYEATINFKMSADG